MGKYFADDIKFVKVADHVFEQDEFEAFTEVNNMHADEKLDSCKKGCYYRSVKLSNDGKVLTKGFIIWDFEKGNVWWIYAGNGCFVRNSLSEQPLLNYVYWQWMRFTGKAWYPENQRSFD